MTRKRIPNDEYRTPLAAIDTIIEEIDWSKINSIWDPACGDYRIINTIFKRFPNTTIAPLGTDIKEGLGYDYRHHTELYYGRLWSLIITNPPYSLAQEFVAKALTEAHNVAMLLRLNFLGSKKRRDWWNEVLWNNRQIFRLYVLSNRPKFISVCKTPSCKASFHADETPEFCPFCEGKVYAGTDSTEYGWFCWGPAFHEGRGVFVR